jgi:electron transfer flavoprotein alpha subunit
MVLIVADHQDGKLKKAAFEAVTFGKNTADALGTSCKAVVLGKVENAGELGTAGASEVLQVEEIESFDDQIYTSVIAQVAEAQGARLIVLSHSSTGKAILGRLAVKLGASSSSGINELDVDNGYLIATRPAYSGKAIEKVKLLGDKSVVTLTSNAVQPASDGAVASVNSADVSIPDSSVEVRAVERVEGRVPLPEAELVVSAGRGVKDPSNWGIIEDLAEALGATTACSRPVADSDWRPHHEHVGQTGIAIRPNLYIAIGISGAIQHLAGVNNSRVIVVINKDPEAPFFKAADYGVLADLFDVVPKLTEAVKRFNSN